MESAACAGLPLARDMGGGRSTGGDMEQIWEEGAKGCSGGERGRSGKEGGAGTADIELTGKWLDQHKPDTWAPGVLPCDPSRQ